MIIICDDFLGGEISIEKCSEINNKYGSKIYGFIAINLLLNIWIEDTLINLKLKYSNGTTMFTVIFVKFVLLINR